MVRAVSENVEVERIDLADVRNFADGPPWELFKRLRDEAPVHYNPLPDEQGFWSITRHEDIARVSQDSETFSSGRRGVFLRDEQVLPWEVMKTVLLNQDPPAHTQIRGTVQRFFTAGAVSRLEARVRALCCELLDAVIERGECDLVADVAVELPMRVVADLLGVPRVDQAWLLDLTIRIGDLAGLDAQAISERREQALQDFAKIGEYVVNLVAERRREPRDDLISHLIAADLDGRRLEDIELITFVSFLMSAGSEETRNAYTGGVLALIEHPDERRKLLADPGLIPTAVEEILRWVSPIIHMRRTTTRAVSIRDVMIGEDEKVVMWLPSGNRDERVFVDPDRFDVTREPNRHQAFGGGGRHFCLGNQLARLQLRVLLEETFKRIPDPQLAGPVVKKPSTFFHGILRMPIEFASSRRGSTADA